MRSVSYSTGYRLPFLPIQIAALHGITTRTRP